MAPCDGIHDVAQALREHRRALRLQQHSEEDPLISHAARLGYAWRKAKQHLQEDPQGEILLDLHAELLQRLGFRLQVKPSLPPGKNLRRARGAVQDAVAYLRRIATSAPTATGDSTTTIPTAIGGSTTFVSHNHMVMAPTVTGGSITKEDADRASEDSAGQPSEGAGDLDSSVTPGEGTGLTSVFGRAACTDGPRRSIFCPASGSGDAPADAPCSNPDVWDSRASSASSCFSGPLSDTCQEVSLDAALATYLASRDSRPPWCTEEIWLSEENSMR